MSVLISRAFAEVDDKVGPLPAKRQAEGCSSRGRFGVGTASKANECNRFFTRFSPDMMGAWESAARNATICENRNALAVPERQHDSAKARINRRSLLHSVGLY